MAFYKLDKFHFHITDDEGWRLQIPGLPELTDVGSKRGYSKNELEMLANGQLFNGSTKMIESSIWSSILLKSQEDFDLIEKLADIVPHKFRATKLLQLNEK